MIVDCFTFFDEFDVLELHLRTLEDVVDRFVICEAPFTFRGTPKPLHLADNVERIARWRDRVTLLRYDGPPSNDPWQNEWGQRDFLAQGLTDCAPGDLVLIGDCDEIPDPRNVAARPRTQRILAHRMMMAEGYVNRLAPGTWDGTRAVRAGDLQYFAGLSDVRKRPEAERDVIEGGWHFTSLGGAAVMERKLRTFSHVEYDIPYFRDRRRLEMTYAGDASAWRPVDDRLPLPLRDAQRWAPFIWDAAGAVEPARARALEHAHGCFAYVDGGARSVAVLAHEADAWAEAGTARFGGAFSGVFSNVAALAARGRDACVVIDGLGRFPRSTLAALAASGTRVVAFAANARSFEVFGRVLHGGAPFPAGRAIGRAEAESAARDAGFTLAAADRAFTYKLTIPVNPDTSAGATVDCFTFKTATADELYDFLADAFVFVLHPPAED